MKMRRRIISIFSIVVFVLAIIVPIHKTNASLVTTVSDVMTRLADSTLSSHDISFTMVDGDTFAATETITIDFKEDAPDTYFTVDGAATVAGDFDFNDGTERTVVASGACSGTPANEVQFAINDTTGVVSFTACAGYTASGANAAINIEYGTAAAGPGTNRVTNDNATGSKIIDIAGTFGGADTGSFAVAIVDDDQVVVSTTIDAYLTFTLTTNTVSLTGEIGTGNTSSTDTGINEGAANTLLAATNANTGYSLTYSGATLSNGVTDITAMGGGASVKNSKQFGLNLKDNATPDTGAEPTGTGSGTPASGYGTADSFKFVTGSAQALASAGAATKSNTYTVAYIANVAEDTPAGAYQTTITYIATGNF